MARKVTAHFLKHKLVMGPVGRLWLNLEEVRTGKSPEERDLFECLRLFEQSVTLLGQANVSLTYARRLAILGRLTGDAKKAKKLLSKYWSCLTQSQKSLLGKKVRQSLALTNLACTGMVTSPVGDVLQASHSTSPTEGSFTLSQPTVTPSDSAGPPAISGLDG